MYNTGMLVRLVVVCLLLLANRQTASKAAENVTDRLEQREAGFDIEEELLQKLFSKYDKSRKPRGQVDIRFALNLNQILMIRAKDQIFELNTFLDQEWVDPRLAWGNSELELFDFVLSF